MTSLWFCFVRCNLCFVGFNSGLYVLIDGLGLLLLLGFVWADGVGLGF